MDSSDCAYIAVYERIDSLKIGAGYERQPSLLEKIINNPDHTLHQLLPPQSTA